MSTTTLDSIDEIRRRLTPDRLARLGVTAEGLRGTRLWVDGRPVMVYPVPDDPAEAVEPVRTARAAALAQAARSSHDLRGMPTETERRARTEANLDRLRSWGSAFAERARRGDVRSWL